MDVQIYRTNASSYQKSDFFYQEQAKLESIPGVRYVQSLTGASTDKPFILITNTHTKPDELPSGILDKTILMIHPNSGYDNFNQNFIQTSSFPIVIGNQIRASAVAEYILAAIFQEFCRIPTHHHWSIDRTWDRPLLAHKKVLLFGYGHIGKILYQSLLPLVGQLTVFDPYTQDRNPHLVQQWSDEVISNTDILITVASLNDSNKNFFNADKLKGLSSDALVINTARGELFEEDNLVALASKHPKIRFYLDVFNEEPFSPGYLHNLPNVLKTSHIAGVSSHLNERIVDFEYQVIVDYLQSLADNQPEQFVQRYHNSLLTNRLVQGMIT